MTRLQVVCALFFVIALGLFVAVQFWGGDSVPDSKFAGTYVLDREAFVKKALAPNSPGQQQIQKKRDEVKASIKTLPPKQAGQARKDLDATIAKMEDDLHTAATKLADHSTFELQLRPDGTFHQKIEGVEHKGVIGEGRWNVKDNELTLVYERMNDLKGAAIKVPAGSTERAKWCPTGSSCIPPNSPPDYR